MSKPKPGDTVTCHYAVEAYDSDYGLNKGKRIVFNPGMMGVVKSIAPKVTISKNDDPRYDMKENFLVVDYFDEDNNKQRVGLHYCNARVIDDTYEITVVFRRSFSDDSDVVKEKFEVTQTSLRTQFAQELQSCYDATMISGSFEVVSGPTFKTCGPQIEQLPNK